MTGKIKFISMFTIMLLLAFSGTLLGQTLTTAETVDANKDGIIDHFKLTFDATVTHDIANYTTVTFADSVTGTSIVLDGIAGNGPAGIYDSPNNAVVYFIIKTPEIVFNGYKTQSYSVTYTTTLGSNSKTGYTSDAVAPQLYVVYTIDSDKDGHVDKLLAVFTEEMIFTDSYDGFDYYTEAGSTPTIKYTWTNPNNNPIAVANWSTYPTLDDVALYQQGYGYEFNVGQNLSVGEEEIWDNGITAKFIFDESAQGAGKFARDAKNDVPLKDIQDAIVLDRAAPLVMYAMTQDMDVTASDPRGDGLLDLMKIRITEEVDPTKIDLTAFQIKNTYEEKSILKVENNSDLTCTIWYELKERTGEPDTGDKPYVTVTGPAKFWDYAKNRAGDDFISAAQGIIIGMAVDANWNIDAPFVLDGIMPRIKLIQTYDATVLLPTVTEQGNGKVDGLQIVFTEAVNATSNSGVFIKRPVIKNNYYLDNVSNHYNNTDIASTVYWDAAETLKAVSFSNSSSIIISYTEGSHYDTDVLMTMLYDPATGNFVDNFSIPTELTTLGINAGSEIASGDANELVGYGGTYPLLDIKKVFDGAKPVLVELRTGDTKTLRFQNSTTVSPKTYVGNGRIDYVELVFSENITVFKSNGIVDYYKFYTNMNLLPTTTENAYQIYDATSVTALTSGTTSKDFFTNYSSGTTYPDVISKTKDYAKLDSDNSYVSHIFVHFIEDPTQHTGRTPSFSYDKKDPTDANRNYNIEDVAGELYASLNPDQLNVRLDDITTLKVTDNAPPVILGFTDLDGSTTGVGGSTTNLGPSVFSAGHMIDTGRHWDNATIGGKQPETLDMGFVPRAKGGTGHDADNGLTNDLNSFEYGNGDGYVDAFKVYTSEPMNSTTASLANCFEDYSTGVFDITMKEQTLAITGYEQGLCFQYPYFTFASSILTDEFNYVVVKGTSTQNLISGKNPGYDIQGNTDAVTKLNYVGTAIVDTNGVAMLKQYDNQNTIDKAPPIIMQAMSTYKTDLIVTTISEPVGQVTGITFNNSTNYLAYTDFIYFDNNGTDVSDFYSGLNTAKYISWLTATPGQEQALMYGNTTFSKTDIIDDSLRFVGTYADYNLHLGKLYVKKVIPTVVDEVGNRAYPIVTSIDDRIGPYVIDARTLDLDMDGWIDHIVFTFSEFVNDAYLKTLLAADVAKQWDFTPRYATVGWDFTVTGDVTDDATIYLKVTENKSWPNSDTKMGDTDSEPTYTHTNNPEVKDLGLNLFETNYETAVAASVGVYRTDLTYTQISPPKAFKETRTEYKAYDGAGPVLMAAATVNYGHILAVFSEDIKESTLATDGTDFMYTFPKNDLSAFADFELIKCTENVWNNSAAELKGRVSLLFNGVDNWAPFFEGEIVLSGVGVISDEATTPDITTGLATANLNPIMGNTAPETRFDVATTDNLVKIDDGLAARFEMTTTATTLTAGVPVTVTVKAYTENGNVAFNYGNLIGSSVTFGANVSTNYPYGNVVLQGTSAGTNMFANMDWGGLGSFEITPKATSSTYAVYITSSNADKEAGPGATTQWTLTTVSAPSVTAPVSVTAVDVDEDNGYLIKVTAPLSTYDPASSSYAGDAVVGMNKVVKYQIYRSVSETANILAAEVSQADGAGGIEVYVYVPDAATHTYSISALSAKLTKPGVTSKGVTKFTEPSIAMKVGDILTGYSSALVSSSPVAAVDNVPVSSPATNLTYSTSEAMQEGTSVTLKWDISSDDKVVDEISFMGVMIPVYGVEKYNVYRSADGEDFTLAGTVNRGTTTYTDVITGEVPSGLSYKIGAADGSSEALSAKGVNTTGILDDMSFVPEVFAVHQNYPNPFNPSTTITYDIPKSSQVTVEIYNMVGQLVRSLVNNESKGTGRYKIEWNADNNAGSLVSSGMYLLVVKTNKGDVSTKKMVFLK